MNCSSFPGHGNCKQIVKFPWSTASATPALWPRWDGEPLAHRQAGADAATPLPNKPEAGPADAPAGQGLCRPAAGRFGSKPVKPPTMAPRLPALAFPDPSRRSPSLRGACPATSPTHRLEAGRPAAILRPCQHRAFSLALASQPMGWVHSGLRVVMTTGPVQLCF